MTKVKVIDRLVAKKTQAALGCLIFFAVCILGILKDVDTALLGAILGPLGILIGTLYGIKAVSGNFAKRTDMLAGQKKDPS